MKVSQFHHIEKMNLIRSSIDRLKGGKFAKYFSNVKINSWIVSDVIQDDPGIIGSGPTSVSDRVYKDDQCFKEMDSWLKFQLINSEVRSFDLCEKLLQSRRAFIDRSGVNHVENAIILRIMAKIIPERLPESIQKDPKRSAFRSLYDST